MELKMVGEGGTVNAQDAIFGREFNQALVHQLVVAYQANARLATRAQKDRGAVNHSTKKPWRQKGTGRARAGMTSSPLWRGGGRIFPKSPDENFTHKGNKKMYLASRNLKNVMVVEPRYADPMSLIHFKRVVVTKSAIAKLEEMFG